MSKGDSTGPMGMGPRTGRGAGFCNRNEAPGYANAAGWGCGFGPGRGFRRMFNATALAGRARSVYPAYQRRSGAAWDENAFLNNQAKFLEQELQQVKKRLTNLDKEAD